MRQKAHYEASAGTWLNDAEREWNSQNVFLKKELITFLQLCADIVVNELFSLVMS